MSKRILKFEGVDSFSRPIFKDAQNNRFGCTHKLFSYEATGEEVLKEVTEFDICYFGSTFDCEPDGTRVKPDRIKLEV